LMPAVGVSFAFTEMQTSIVRCNLDDTPELAERMPLWQRMRDRLRADGPLTISDLAERLDAKPDAVRKAAQRSTRTFTKITAADGVPKVALVTRRYER